MLERRAVEREREQRGVSDQIAEARAREARRALHVEAADLGVLPSLRERRRLARARDLDGVLLLAAVRNGLVGRVRHLGEQLVARRLGGGVLLLGRTELLLHLLQLGELLRRGLALQLRLPAQLVDRRHERAPALVGLQQRVERVAGALPRQRRAVRVRIVAGGLEVDHGVKSRSASITWATPSSSADGQIQSARAFKPFVRVLDRDAEAGPVEQLEIVLAVAERDRLLGGEAELLGHEGEPAPLRDRGAGQLEEVRQRLGDVETPAELLLEPRPERVEAVGIVDDDELRRRPLDPAEQVADLVQRDALEVGVGAGVLGDARRRRGRRRRSS